MWSIVKSGAVSECFLNHNYFPDDPEFSRLVKQVEEAIECGVYPERIKEGSSGAYFAKNLDNESVGIFKPKNEEPYGPKNPKWTKWFQKIISPCCFGRGCLLMNQGYLSEAGASLVDEKLGLDIVPKTRVVWLASPTFYYSDVERTTAESRLTIARACPRIGKRFNLVGLPPKVGALQTFAEGYKDSATFLKENDLDKATEAIKHDFKLQFERLVVLDYIIRNTDRGDDNWLIKLEEPDPSATTAAPSKQKSIDRAESAPAEESIKTKTTAGGLNSAQSAAATPTSPTLPQASTVKIAAIDNGLAFPFKHPDEWRLYPFGWQDLPIAKEPFSEEMREYLCPRLEDINYIEELCDDLKCLFQLDKEFTETMFEKQMSVMRGQILNLKNILQQRKSPFDLVNETPTVVAHKSGKTPGRKQKTHWSMYDKKETKKAPVFSKF